MLPISRSLFIIVCCAVTGISCGPSQEEINAQIIARYDMQVAQLKDKKSKECHLEALRIAEIIADSIVSGMQINPLDDDQYRPDIPLRPQYVPVDSSVFESKRSVKPIL